MGTGVGEKGGSPSADTGGELPYADSLVDFFVIHER